MGPQVDLVLVFRAAAANGSKVQPKSLARQNARQASEQYARLLAALARGGLHAVGKRGERDGQLLVLVACPAALLRKLVRRERCVLLSLPLLSSLLFLSGRADGGKTETRTF